MHTLLAFGLLFLFYFFIDDVGMVLGSFILYAAFARLCGERNWLRLLLTDCILTAALYVFSSASPPCPFLWAFCNPSSENRRTRSGTVYCHKGSIAPR